MVRLAHRTHGRLDVSRSGELLRHVLGEDRDRDVREQLPGARRHGVDVAGDRQAGSSRHPRERDRRRFVGAIDVDDARAGDVWFAEPLRRDIEPRVPLPQDSTLAARTIDEDDRVSVGGRAHDRARYVDAPLGKLLTHAASVVVVSDRAEEARVQAERRARGHRCRHLSAAGRIVALDPGLR